MPIPLASHSHALPAPLHPHSSCVCLCSLSYMFLLLPYSCLLTLSLCYKHNTGLEYDNRKRLLLCSLFIYSIVTLCVACPHLVSVAFLFICFSNTFLNKVFYSLKILYLYSPPWSPATVYPDRLWAHRHWGKKKVKERKNTAHAHTCFIPLAFFLHFL